MRPWGVATALLVVVALACTEIRADATERPLTEEQQQQLERLEWVAKVLEKEGRYGMLAVVFVVMFTRKSLDV